MANFILILGIKLALVIVLKLTTDYDVKIHSVKGIKNVA